MYNIGIVPIEEKINNTYIKKLSEATYRLHPLAREEVFEEASNMDALIIEETSSTGLKNTCELILELRRNFKTLIWVVSKNLTKTSKIVYLQLGADGVVDEVEGQEESLLQFSNILNRLKSTPEQARDKEFELYNKNKLMNNQLKLIPNNLSVVVDGKEVTLTRLEFQTLSLLLKNVGKAVPYEEIYQTVWQSEFVNEEKGNKQYRVSNLIFHLRKKLEVDPTLPNYIKTVRSKGYMVINESRT